MASYRFISCTKAPRSLEPSTAIAVATMERGAMRSICWRRGLLPPLSKTGSLMIPLSMSGSLGAWLPDMNEGWASRAASRGGVRPVVRQARPADEVGSYTVQGSRRECAETWDKKVSIKHAESKIAALDAVTRGAEPLGMPRGPKGEKASGRCHRQRRALGWVYRAA
jgi:hypothetical protein